MRPDTPLTALARYLVADPGRARRGAMLMTVAALAASVAVSLVIVVISVTDVSGLVLGAGSSVAGLAVAGLRRRQRQDSGPRGQVKRLVEGTGTRSAG